MNGAGKSTLVSLLARLRDPTGGQITVDSTLGIGSLFSFALAFGLPTQPALSVGPRLAAEPAARPGLLLAGRRLLIVEDDLVNQAVAAGILESEGAVTTIAVNGRAAVELLRSVPFDAVLMDLQMPEMDGYAATRAIRGELGLTRLPMVAVCICSDVSVTARYIKSNSKGEEAK